jgi:uncharacterized membrane protein (UPF0127 family)
VESQSFEIVVARTNTLVATSVEEVAGRWQRFRGLMLSKDLHDNRGLLIRPARGIHTHFMRFPIDLIYLDERNRVVKIRSDMPPWRIDPFHAAAVIEVAAGLADAGGVRIGDEIVLRPFQPPAATRG